MNQTISASHMHAKAIEYLQEKLTPGSKVLDVGSGSHAKQTGDIMLGLEKIVEIEFTKFTNLFGC